ncbi:MAG: hypothetical protein ABSE54_10910, partial [Smithella sp.]
MIEIRWVLQHPECYMYNSTEYSMVFFRHLNHRTQLHNRKDAHTGAHNRYGLDIHRKEEFCCLLPETPIEE